MTEPFRKRDHVADGLSKLLEQYKGKPRIAALLRSYLLEVQELEDAAWNVITKRLLDNASDAQLDVIGKIVDQIRIGETDDEYRLFIAVRIAINISDGQGDDVQNVADLLLGDLPWSYEDLYPATILIEAFEVEGNLQIIASLLDEATGGGVAMAAHLTSHASDEIFSFASGDDPTTGVGLGFSSTDDPTTGPGGVWIGDF